MIIFFIHCRVVRQLLKNGGYFQKIKLEKLSGETVTFNQYRIHTKYPLLCDGYYHGKTQPRQSLIPNPPQQAAGKFIINPFRFEKLIGLLSCRRHDLVHFSISNCSGR